MNSDQMCCPKFDPASWQERWLALDGKRFVKDRVRSFLHIPLNFGGVMVRNMAAIQKAGAEVPHMRLLSDETSLWGADVYLEVAKDVPGRQWRRFPAPSWHLPGENGVGARGRA